MATCAVTGTTRAIDPCGCGAPGHSCTPPSPSSSAKAASARGRPAPDHRMGGMTPEEVGERMVALLTADAADAPADGTITAGVSGGGPAHERAVVDVPAALWWAALDAARDPGGLGCDFFDRP